MRRVEYRVEMEREACQPSVSKYIISALGLKQVQSACCMRSAVACQVQRCQYIYFLRSLSGYSEASIEYKKERSLLNVPL